MNSFSIILPVYNGGRYVKQCVQSLLSQTYPNFNVIVLDNCSTDGTTEWILSLRDKRISLIRSERKLSITENWARIKDVQKNEFMTMIGHDDILLPHYLTTMDALIEKHPEASLYQSHFNFIDANDKLVKQCQPMAGKMSGAEFLGGQLTRNLDSMGTGYLMRSADYDSLGGIPVSYPNLIFADYALWMMLSEKSYLAVSPDVSFHYRIHDSVSKVTNGEDYQQAFFMYLDFLKERMKADNAIRTTFETNGHDYLMFFCESLSHRILKTPVGRRELTVEEFVRKCSVYAVEMLPGTGFDPFSRRRIALAVWFDRSQLRRSAFKVIKKMTLPFFR